MNFSTASAVNTAQMIVAITVLAALGVTAARPSPASAGSYRLTVEGDDNYHVFENEYVLSDLPNPRRVQDRLDINYYSTQTGRQIGTIANGKLPHRPAPGIDPFVAISNVTEFGLVVTGTRLGYLSLWDITGGRTLKSYKFENGSQPQRIDLADDGSKMVVCEKAMGAYQSCRLYDLRRDKYVNLVLNPNSYDQYLSQGLMGSVKFSKDSELFSIMNLDPSLGYVEQVYSMQNGRLLNVLPGARLFHSRDGKKVVTQVRVASDPTNSFNVYDLTNPNPVYTVKAEEGEIAFEFSKEQTNLMTFQYGERLPGGRGFLSLRVRNYNMLSNEFQDVQFYIPADQTSWGFSGEQPRVNLEQNKIILPAMNSRVGNVGIMVFDLQTGGFEQGILTWRVGDFASPEANAILSTLGSGKIYVYKD